MLTLIIINDTEYNVLYVDEAFLEYRGHANHRDPCCLLMGWVPNRQDGSQSYPRFVLFLRDLRFTIREIVHYAFPQASDQLCETRISKISHSIFPNKEET